MQDTSPPGRQGKKSGSARTKKATRSPKQVEQRRPRLSAEAIVDAAIRIADAEGLDAVSIRRVAGELDARPMSLYTHISNKGELLGLMGDKVAGEVLLEQTLPDDWRQALTAIARKLYGTLVAHPWLPFIFSQYPRFGPNSTKQAKQLARAVDSLSLESAEIWVLVGALNDYVLGHSLRAVTVAKPSDLKEVIAPSDVVEFPELSTLPDYLRSRASVERFERGLKTILDGIEVAVREAEGGRPDKHL